MKLKFKLLTREMFDYHCWSCPSLVMTKKHFYSVYCIYLKKELDYYDGPLAACHGKGFDKKIG